MRMLLQFEPNPPRTTAQQKKIAVKYDGTPIVYDSERLVKARQAFLAALTPFKPDAPLTEAIKLSVCWYFSTPKGGKDGWKVTRPDTDNLMKLLKDCMTKLGFWCDDSQVVIEESYKMQFKAKPHGVVINYQELSPYMEVQNERGNH